MKKILSIILIAVFSSGLAFISIKGYNNAPLNTDIKVMSFNIRCIAIESNPINFWDNRQNAVLDVIKENDADIIGFQELKYAQYQFMKNNLPEYGYYGIARSAFDFLSEFAAVFYKKDRFEALEEETFWLSETPEVMSKGWDASLERVCTRVTLKDNFTNKTFAFYNTHFDHVGVVAREQSVSLILSKIEELNLPAIVTGDMNFHEGSDSYKSFVGGVLKDTRHLAPEGFSDEGGTFNGFGRSSKTTAIDFILISENDFDSLSYKIIRDSDDDGNYPSDHFPLVSIIKQK